MDTKNQKVISDFKENSRIEWIDDRTIYFLEAIGLDVHAYTKEARFNLKKQLYEFEGFYGYCCANKPTIINLRMIQSIIPYVSEKPLLLFFEKKK